MKRGLIAWDAKELPRAALEARLARVRQAVAALDAPAALVASDVFRSNHARALVNFMPFWSRSLLLVPRDGEPVLICGHSQRVHPWVGTVTIAELRPGGNLVGPLVELLGERGWSRLGVVDRRELPWDVHAALAAAKVELLDLSSSEAFDPADAVERAMRRTGVGTTRRLMDEALDGARGESEHALTGRLERALRRGGMEDVVLWLSDGTSRPRPATEARTSARSSVVAAAEYLGHWCMVARPLDRAPEARALFEAALDKVRGAELDVFDLSGARPFRALPPGAALEPGQVVAIHARTADGRYFGDTADARGESLAELL